MSRSALKVLAVVLGLLIVVVLMAGLDNLPRQVRAQIGVERQVLASAQKDLAQARDEVTREVGGDPQLFAGVPASRAWPGALDQASALMAAAGRDMADLAALEKRNRRQDGERAQALMGRERKQREAAATAVAAVRKDAAGWVTFRRDLPRSLDEMERQRRAIEAIDLGAVSAAVQKAQTDWPEKRSDLEGRLAGLRSLKSEAESAWQSSEGARRDAAAGNLAGIAAIAGATSVLRNASAVLPRQAAELQGLTGQLYQAWDKVLVDMDVRGIGTNRSFDQKIRTVRTRLDDPAGKAASTSSDEKWEEVPRETYEAMKNNLGMAVAHKPAGKYDSEAERVAQPAGFAYVAPPGQANQYGRWERRDGHDFWVFYGQYALLRDLLFNRNYRPLDRGEWEGYRGSRERGRTYYGQDESAGAPRYGSQGTSTRERYSGSQYGSRGGFRDSEYASKPGGYRDSEYATPAARDRNGDASPRTFGRSRRDEPGAVPRAAPPSRSYRPAPSYRPPSRPSSPGRSFGRRR